MLENFNDYMSLIALVLMTLISLRVLFGFLFDHSDSNSAIRIKALMNYNDNEDE